MARRPPPEVTIGMENVEIAQKLAEAADLLEIQGANPFRVRAYRNAARTVERQTESLASLAAAGTDLTAFPGIGHEMADHIVELVESGELSLLDELSEATPRSVIEMCQIDGVGPKTVQTLWTELGVTSVDELEEAAQAGQVASLSGFGEKTQAKILAGIEAYRRHRSRVRLVDADRLIVPLLDHLGEAPELDRLEVAGSYRRRRETVGDIDLLGVAADPAPIMDRFVRFERVENVLAHGETKSSVVLASGIQVDLRLVPRASYGTALNYFTGSKEHNVKLRQRAIARDLKISEYGVFRVRDDDSVEETPMAGREEAQVYGALDLPWIPPELREDRGEIEAAERGGLPNLLELADLRGDLQMHSTWSDGADTIEAMLAACRERGYAYCAVTDHSRAMGIAGGLDAEEVRRQGAEIDELAARYDEIRLLKSLEVDIHADGSLDLADELLAELDLVVASVHSRFNLPQAEQTERIVTALQHPDVSILAHPTGRIINRRDPYDVDVEAVLQAAAEGNVAVELNANPQRLDLKDTHLMRARELGVPIVISTDAHSAPDLALMRYGVEQARRAWLEPSDVLNALELADLMAALR